MNIFRPSTHSRQQGFTLIEAIIGLAILVLTASVVFFALSQMNRIASDARLTTAAMLIVQSNIDTIQSDSPFILSSSTGTTVVPTELQVGTTSSNNIPIYVDPTGGATVVSGSMTTTVTDISNAGLSEYARMATVQLNYTYRNKSFNIVESTVRGSDQ